jgi:hypothetical protein
VGYIKGKYIDEKFERRKGSDINTVKYRRKK